MRINGTPVVDAKRHLSLTITRRDIVKGNNKDPGACAAAQCILRKADVEQARVHIGRTYVKVGNKWTRYQTPRALRSEIIAFDRGGKFEPGTYVLRPLSPADLPNGRRKGSTTKGARDKGSKNRSPKKKRTYHTVANVRAHGANR